jgi:Sulfotransferase family
MLVSHARRMLFIHVRKTGGTSIERLLGELPDVRPMAPRHGGLGQALQKDPRLAGYWTFGFVRNPWDRIASWWSMIETLRDEAQRNEPNPRHPKEWRTSRQFRELSKYPTFETFVTSGMRDHGRLRRPQINYLTTSTRRADYIGRIETFAADVRTVLARLDVPATNLPHVNASYRDYSHYREIYSDITRDRVAEAFRPDIEAFGYEF